MDRKIVEFTTLLRANGLRVSMSEHLDAFHAVSYLGVEDREAFKSALRASMVKRSVDVPVYDELFDLYFSGLGQAIRERAGALMESLEIGEAELPEAPARDRKVGTGLPLPETDMRMPPDQHRLDHGRRERVLAGLRQETERERELPARPVGERTSLHDDFAGSGGPQPGKRPERRALSRAIAAQQREHATRATLEVQTAHELPPRHGDVERAAAQQRLACCGSGHSSHPISPAVSSPTFICSSRSGIAASFGPTAMRPAMISPRR